MQVEKRRTSDGVDLACGVWKPQGQPRGVVVCVHGIRSHAGWYERSCEFFARAGYMTYFPDRRGSGLNREAGPVKVTASLLTADLAELVEFARREHPGLPVHIVGISWGGKLAVAALLERPWLADSLTLVAPGIVARRDISPREKLKVLFSRFFCPGRMMAIPLNDPELFTANPEKVEFIRNDRLSLTECPAALLWASFILDRRVRGRAGELAVPVFLMLAENDPIVDNDGLERFYNELGSMKKQQKTYAGAHHTLEFEPEAKSIFADMTRWFANFDRIGI